MSTTQTQGTQDKATELHEQLQAQLAELVTSQDWQTALETASRFHRYSFGNVMAIFAQAPEATRVAGFGTWKTLGRYVRKGEHGIKILAPCVSKCRCEPQPGETCAKCLGRGSVVRGFKVEHVFDVAQTDGQELTDVRPVLLAGEAPTGLFHALADIAEAAGFRVDTPVGVDEFGGSNGFCDYSASRIAIRVADRSPAQVCKTMAHELAHAMLHGPAAAGVTRDVAEVEAESVAFIVCSAYGLGSDGYSLPYVAGWSAGDVALVAKTGERVVRTARKILEQLEGLAIGEPVETATASAAVVADQPVLAGLEQLTTTNAATERLRHVVQHDDGSLEYVRDGDDHRCALCDRVAVAARSSYDKADRFHTVEADGLAGPVVVCDVHAGSLAKFVGVTVRTRYADLGEVLGRSVAAAPAPRTRRARVRAAA